MAICNKPVECFSRVCGYHRPVTNWNTGKTSEFKERVEYSNGTKNVKIGGKDLRQPKEV